MIFLFQICWPIWIYFLLFSKTLIFFLCNKHTHATHIHTRIHCIFLWQCCEFIWKCFLWFYVVWQSSHSSICGWYNLFLMCHSMCVYVWITKLRRYSNFAYRWCLANGNFYSVRHTNWRRWHKTKDILRYRVRSKCKSMSSIVPIIHRFGIIMFMDQFMWRKICQSVAKLCQSKPGRCSLPTKQNKTTTTSVVDISFAPHFLFFLPFFVHSLDSVSHSFLSFCFVNYLPNSIFFCLNTIWFSFGLWTFFIFCFIVVILWVLGWWFNFLCFMQH